VIETAFGIELAWDSCIFQFFLKLSGFQGFPRCRVSDPVKLFRKTHEVMNRTERIRRTESWQGSLPVGADQDDAVRGFQKGSEGFEEAG